MIRCSIRVFVLHMAMGLGCMYGSEPKPVQQPIEPTLLAAKRVVRFAYRKKRSVSRYKDDFVDVPLGNAVKSPAKPVLKSAPKDSLGCEGFCSIQ